MQTFNGNEIIPRPDGIVVEREIRRGDGWTFYRVTLHGPNTYRFLASANRIIAAQARLWAKELGMSSGGWVTGGGGWNGEKGKGNHAYSSKVYHFA
jgi:hypothetical protein